MLWRGELASQVMADRLREAEAFRQAKLAEATNGTREPRSRRVRTMVAAMAASLRPAHREPRPAVPCLEVPC